jgi:hypothetical protein
MAIIEVRDEAHWHELRGPNIGGHHDSCAAHHWIQVEFVVLMPSPHCMHDGVQQFPYQLRWHDYAANFFFPIVCAHILFLSSRVRPLVVLPGVPRIFDSRAASLPHTTLNAHFSGCW